MIQNKYFISRYHIRGNKNEETKYRCQLIATIIMLISVPFNGKIIFDWSFIGNLNIIIKIGKKMVKIDSRTKKNKKIYFFINPSYINDMKKIE